MAQETQSAPQKRPGRIIFFSVIVLEAFLLLLSVYQVDLHPRTDDANVWANFIEIAPEVSGRLLQLPVKDNAFVKTGGLLFVIDPRPYEYALQQALADEELLEQQIIDENRKIAAQNSAVDAAGAALHVSRTGIQTASSSIDLAKAAVTRAQAAVAAAEARLKYATNDLNRIQPLLQKQYVTVDQVDQANTAVRVAQGNYDESEAALIQSQAALNQSILQHE